MKLKKMLFASLSILSFFSLASCSIDLLNHSETETEDPEITIYPNESEDYTVPTPETPGQYSVTFVCNNGYTYASTTNEYNKVLRPEDPTKTCATFLGWYIDAALTFLFDFTTAVNDNTVLYAAWNIDYVSLFNEVTTDYVTTNVRIEVENYEMSGGFGISHKSNTSTALGSGVVFYKSDGYYYALTNNHVVYTKTSFQTIIVEDAYENEYDGTLIAHSADYDLAILRFQSDMDLKVIPIAGYTLSTNDLIFAVGEPEGLSNTVSLGYIKGTKDFVPNEEDIVMSNVTFEVYMFSAPIASGSSGGALIDSNLRLAGVNFASAYDKDSNEFKYGYAIPAYRVREFIKENLNLDI